MSGLTEQEQRLTLGDEYLLLVAYTNCTDSDIAPLLAEIDRIIAARVAALRAEIATQIEAAIPADPQFEESVHKFGRWAWTNALRDAARIARGDSGD